MRFPDAVVRTPTSSTDEYGNPGAAPTPAGAQTLQGFLVTPELLLLPASAVVEQGDRLAIDGTVYTATKVTRVRSPSATKLWTVEVKEATR